MNDKKAVARAKILYKYLRADSTLNIQDIVNMLKNDRSIVDLDFTPAIDILTRQAKAYCTVQLELTRVNRRYRKNLYAKAVEQIQKKGKLSRGLLKKLTEIS